MLVVVFEQIDPLAVTENSINTLRFTKRRPCAVNIEEVLRAHAHQRRPWCAQRNIVCMVHPERHLSGDVLFRVLRAQRGEQSLQRRDVARRRRRQNALIQRHQISGQSAATGVARATQPLGIDLGARGQVIETADSIPDSVRGCTLADQQGTDAEHRVLRRAPRDGGLTFFVEQLRAFALTDWVIA